MPNLFFLFTCPVPTRSDFSNHTIFLHFCEHSFLLIPSGMDIECNKINHHHHCHNLVCLKSTATILYVQNLYTGIPCRCQHSYRGTFRDNHTSDLSHLSTFSSYLNVIIGENLFTPFFSFTFKPKILQSFISSQLTTWFRHDSQKTSMPPLISQ